MKEWILQTALSLSLGGPLSAYPKASVDRARREGKRSIGTRRGPKIKRNCPAAGNFENSAAEVLAQIDRKNEDENDANMP